MHTHRFTYKVIALSVLGTMIAVAGILPGPAPSASAPDAQAPTLQPVGGVSGVPSWKRQKRRLERHINKDKRAIKRYDRLRRRAELDIRGGRFGQALAKYERIVNMPLPGSVRAKNINRMASLARKSGRVSSAIGGFRRLLKVHKDDPPTEARLNYVIGTLYNDIGKPERSIKHFSQAFEKYPDPETACTWRIVASLRLIENQEIEPVAGWLKEVLETTDSDELRRRAKALLRRIDTE